MSDPPSSQSKRGNPAFQLNHVSRLMTRYFDRRLALLGVNVAYLAVLRALQESGRLSQKELIEIGRIGQPAMAQMLERMVKDDLLVRAQDAGDKRKAIFALSDTALELIPQIKAVLNEGNAEVFAALDETELTEFLDTMQKLEDRLTSLGK
ncbi:transcriptional regulator SlyA [Afipia felis]|uniref:Transcriptional regulator SlyA n=1 Tax=Afipia felis TaxID=1035 RepID=A0A090MVB3_AFIFE|nr:MarR family transcriptional regulator [Afipia felis]CEG10417.1 transcriptional regulator SlyA [Afipia felis]